MEQSSATVIDDLSLLLEDPSAFRRWCGYVGIEDVPGFLHADVPQAQVGPVRQWGQLQAAMRQARRQVNQGDAEAAAHTLVDVAHSDANPMDADGLRACAATLVPAIASRRLPPTARNELVLMGGIGGAAEIARRLTRRLRKRVSVRMVRDRLRHTNGVRKLGAGYYAVRYHPAATVSDWAASLIAQEGAISADELVKRILAQYPNGAQRAVNAWVYQDPGQLMVRDRKVVLRASDAA